MQQYYRGLLGRFIAKKKRAETNFHPSKVRLAAAMNILSNYKTNKLTNNNKLFINKLSNANKQKLVTEYPMFFL